MRLTALQRFTEELLEQLNVSLGKQHKGEAVLYLLKHLCTELKFFQTAFHSEENDTLCHSCKQLAEQLLTTSWEELHTGEWNKVSDMWRDIYTLSSMLLVWFSFLWKRDVEEASRLLDLAVLLGTERWKEPLLSWLDSLYDRLEESEEKYTTVLLVDHNCLNTCIETLTFPLKSVVHRPSLEECFTQFISVQKPALIQGVANQWPCIKEQLWNQVSYWKQVAGNRLVPVEVGEHYMSEHWGQRLMRLSQFIDEYILHPTPETPTGYLAQHNLLEQVPDLKKDIQIPEYCYLSEENVSPRICIWFGPKGTQTPLHYDSQHNFFVQVVGCKYFRLYAPQESEKLYPSNGTIHKNTSLIANVQEVDQNQFPAFFQASYQEYFVCSGDMLYIPPGYWHYVRAVDTSISLSFWWT
eukprot:jgi/Galph1/3503/GphlegSOOS_G2155.1